MFTVLDGKGAAQPAVVAPGRAGRGAAGLEDVDGDGLHAQRDDLVQPAGLASIVALDADTPRGTSGRRPAQRKPGIDQAVLGGQGVVDRVESVEVACDDATAAPGLVQEVGHYLHLERTPELGLEGLEVHVDQAQDGTRRRGGSDAHAERVPLVPAGERGAEDAVEHQPGAALVLTLALVVGEQRRAKTAAGEQRHGRERHAGEGSFVLGVGRQEA